MKVWTAPPERMKRGVEHRVPLSDRATAIVTKMAEIKRGEYVFPTHRADRSRSGMAMNMLLRRMNVTGATTHGFRSSFRD
jgi:integrase